jgi:hypothetical protein
VDLIKKEFEYSALTIGDWVNYCEYLHTSTPQSSSCHLILGGAQGEKVKLMRMVGAWRVIAAFRSLRVDLV